MPGVARAPPGRPRRWPLVVAIAAVVAVGTLLVLTIVPFPQSFSFGDAYIPDPNPGCSGIVTSKGTTVTFSWNAPSPVDFFVVSCGGHGDPYYAFGTVGSGSFVSAGGAYEFGASCPKGPCVGANVTGHFSGPLLLL